MCEIWKDVTGYDGLYSVSNLGNVYSVRRNKILRGGSTNRGYKTVLLVKNGVKKRYLVHRLVAMAFCEKSKGRDVVNHIDNDIANNSANNLEWVTTAENVNHALKQGRLRTDTIVFAIEKCKRPVIATNGSNIFHFNSMSDAEKEGFKHGAIWRCCNGEMCHHKGLSWRYADAE